MPWEKPTPHHKWADELEAEAKAKSDLRKAKLAAKAEDHSKRLQRQLIELHHTPHHDLAIVQMVDVGGGKSDDPVPPDDPPAIWLRVGRSGQSGIIIRPLTSP